MPTACKEDYENHYHHHGVHQAPGPFEIRKSRGDRRRGKERIQSGEATVNGEVCTMRGKKIRPGDDVVFQGEHYTVAYAD